MGAGNPFRHVSSGDPLHIPAAAYNAMIAAARAHARGTLGSSAPGVDSPVAYDTIIRNDTGGDLDRFAVVTVGAPLTTPVDRLAGFLNGSAHEGTTPATADRGKFAVLQEPVREDAFGRALRVGITIARVELLSSNTVDDDFADIKSADATVLQGAAHGSARLLWVEPLADRTDANKPWCVVLLGDRGPGELFNVLLDVDGGSSGSSSSTCSWTYTVKSLRGKTIATAKSPEAHRLPNFVYVSTPAGSEGIAFYDQTGALKLLWANEQPDIENCETDTVTLDGGSP